MVIAAAEAAPAKINLALHVVGRRADGYHNLESLVVFAEVGDELEASVAPADTLRITGPFAAGLPANETNLVIRAVGAFRDRWPDTVAGGLSIELKKNLPVASGIGGGSADAAAALRLMAGLSAQPIAYDDLAAIALTLGADVPACLLSRPCEMRGIGEIVRPLPEFPPCHIVLVNPLLPVVTAEVFRRLHRHDNEPLPELPRPMSRPAQLGLWLETTRNDLEGPAITLVSVIDELAASLRRAPGCSLARMSGSGATVFGLFGSGAQAHQAAHDLRAQWPGYWVAASPLIQPDQ
jgi:4-diphosphocytidyl-2-C-methyl-D-erythritol kinase